DALHSRLVLRLAGPLLAALLLRIPLGEAHGDVQPKELTVLAEEAADRAEHRAQFLRERQIELEGGVDAGVELRHGALECFLDELVAVAEVEIDRPLGHAGLVGNLLHRRGSHALASNDPHGGVLDRLDPEIVDDFLFRLRCGHQFTALNARSVNQNFRSDARGTIIAPWTRCKARERFGTPRWSIRRTTVGWPTRSCATTSTSRSPACPARGY